MRADNDLLLMCISIELVLVRVVDIDLVLYAERNHLVLVLASNLTSFLCRWSKLT